MKGLLLPQLLFDLMLFILDHILLAIEGSLQSGNILGVLAVDFGELEVEVALGGLFLLEHVLYCGILLGYLGVSLLVFQFDHVELFLHFLQLREIGLELLLFEADFLLKTIFL